MQTEIINKAFKTKNNKVIVNQIYTYNEFDSNNSISNSYKIKILEITSQSEIVFIKMGLIDNENTNKDFNYFIAIINNNKCENWELTESIL